MNQLRTYGIPSVIIVAVALLVCLALWGIYQGAPQSEIEASTVEFSAVTENSEPEMPDLGAFTPILSFVMTGLKQALFMGIPGLITWQALRTTRRKRAYG